MRSVSTEIETVINSRGYSSYWLVDINLPEQGGIEAANFYVSDSAVSASGHFYRPLLRSQKPRMIQTLGRAPDGGSIVIDNIEGDIGQAIVKRGRNFDGAKFVLWKGFLLGEGQIGLDKWMEGDIRAANISESDQTITFQLNSDLLKRQAIMGAFMLSQRCITAFNKNGLLTPAESRCGWQTIMGGDPGICDKTEDGENGCRAHGNLHRMVAVPAITATANISTTIGGGGTGFPGNGGPTCFLAGTPVMLPGGGSKPIEQIEAGDEILSPVYDEAAGEDALRRCPVEAVRADTAREWLEIQLPHGSLFVTPKHRFYTGAGTFRAIGDIRIGETVRAGLPGGFQDCPVLDKIQHSGEAKVYNLSVKYSRTYFANLVAVHNVKNNPIEYPEFPWMS
jgi:hypothetical protein